MDRPLPQATPALAKAVWARQRCPSARTVATALSQAGMPIHYTTIARWRKQNWRAVPAVHPLEQARADLAAALPLLTGDPRTTIADLVGARLDLEGLTDDELLRRTGRELLMAVTLAAHCLLRQETLIVRSTGAVAILIRALTACLRVATTAGVMRCECRRNLPRAGRCRPEHTPPHAKLPGPIARRRAAELELAALKERFRRIPTIPSRTQSRLGARSLIGDLDLRGVEAA